MHLKEANGKTNWTNEKGDEMRKRFSCQWRQIGLEMLSIVTKTCGDRPFKSRDSWCAGAASNSWWVTSPCSPRLAGSTQLGAPCCCDADLFEDSEVNNSNILLLQRYLFLETLCKERIYVMKCKGLIVQRKLFESRRWPLYFFGGKTDVNFQQWKELRALISDI